METNHAWLQNLRNIFCISWKTYFCDDLVVERKNKIVSSHFSAILLQLGGNWQPCLCPSAQTASVAREKKTWMIMQNLLGERYPNSPTNEWCGGKRCALHAAWSPARKVQRCRGTRSTSAMSTMRSFSKTLNLGCNHTYLSETTHLVTKTRLMIPGKTLNLKNQIQHWISMSATVPFSGSR